MALAKRAGQGMGEPQPTQHRDKQQCPTFAPKEIFPTPHPA